jgi:hypothetical protein
MASKQRQALRSIVTKASPKAHTVPSFAFSGAGFLTCYHLGVIECLRTHEILNVDATGSNDDTHYKNPRRQQQSHPKVILSGVSGGALASTSVALSVRTDDAMNVTMKIAQTARQTGGIFDHLHPNFSLVDQVYFELQQLTSDIDEEYVLRQLKDNIKLRIGLTDSSLFPFFRRQNSERAYMYVDEYESIEEILAACILSSYVPGLTGPIPLERSKKLHPAMTSATQHLQQMLQRGAVKGQYGQPKQNLINPQTSEFWDGGLSNLFPTINKESILVTPFAGRFQNPTISPATNKNVMGEVDGEQSAVTANYYKRMLGALTAIPVSKYAALDLSMVNMRAMRYVALSSTDEELQSWFTEGYDNALNFINHQSMKSQFSITVPPLSSSMDTTTNRTNTTTKKIVDSTTSLISLASQDTTKNVVI